MGGVCPRPVRRLSLALSRGGADGRGGRRRAAVPASPGRWLPAVMLSGTALSRSVRAARPTVPTILLPFKITVKGAPSARRCCAPQTLEQWSCPPNPLAPIRLDGTGLGPGSWCSHICVDTLVSTACDDADHNRVDKLTSRSLSCQGRCGFRRVARGSETCGTYGEGSGSGGSVSAGAGGGRERVQASARCSAR